MSATIPVAVLGATGSVGQRFIQLLDGHPWFRVAALTGSDSRAGQVYGETCRWVLPEPMPAWAAAMRLQHSDPDKVRAPLVFSALPAPVARDQEPRFAQEGAMVCSNASAYRNEPDVPILLPEINPDHTGLLDVQRRARSWSGGIVTNPNCTSTGMAVALKALADSFGVRRVFAVSLQALSGAGYPGVASLDVADNVVPYVAGEEQKVEWEPRKILGRMLNGKVEPAEFGLSVHTNRVPVTDGHLVCLSVELGAAAEQADVAEALRAYCGPQECQGLPSAPQPVIQLRSEPDRPQPRLDRMAGGGMTTVVGRLRPDPLMDYKFVVLSHNTIRGAAGGSLFNAELLLQQGWIG